MFKEIFKKQKKENSDNKNGEDNKRWEFQKWQEEHEEELFTEISPSVYIDTTKKYYMDISRHEIECYFKHSNYNGRLYLVISLCNDDFEVVHERWSVEFAGDGTNKIIWHEEEFTQTFPLLEQSSTQINYLHLRIRKESFIQTVRHGSSWEDLSIGFQCRIERVPNVYNSDFWFHFSNVYIQDEVARAFEMCEICSSLKQERS